MQVRILCGVPILGKIMFEARHKLKQETEEYALCRRLEEYIEYALAVKRFADVGFYLEIIEYIEEKTDEKI